MPAALTVHDVDGNSDPRAVASPAALADILREHPVVIRLHGAKCHHCTAMQPAMDTFKTMSTGRGATYVVDARDGAKEDVYAAAARVDPAGAARLRELRKGGVPMVATWYVTGGAGGDGSALVTQHNAYPRTEAWLRSVALSAKGDAIGAVRAGAARASAALYSLVPSSLRVQLTVRNED